jgi:hypothetical protein
MRSLNLSKFLLGGMVEVATCRGRGRCRDVARFDSVRNDVSAIWLETSRAGGQLNSNVRGRTAEEISCSIGTMGGGLRVAEQSSGNSGASDGGQKQSSRSDGGNVLMKEQVLLMCTRKEVETRCCPWGYVT